MRFYFSFIFSLYSVDRKEKLLATNTCKIQGWQMQLLAGKKKMWNLSLSSLYACVCVRMRVDVCIHTQPIWCLTPLLYMQLFQLCMYCEWRMPHLSGREHAENPMFISSFLAVLCGGSRTPQMETYRYNIPCALFPGSQQIKQAILGEGVNGRREGYPTWPQ